MNDNESEWIKGLQMFVNDILTPVISNREERFSYIDAESMEIWAQAFTHETFSPVSNYEDLEYLGDAILKAVFPKYLMERFPDLHKGDYSELNVAYMSKIQQAALSRKMNLSRFIRIGGLEKAILNVEADVFESFFGALDRVSDRYVRGLGFSNCYNMILYLFSDEDVDESKAKGPAKTQVIQMFSRFDLPHAQETAPGSHVSIRVKPKLAALMKDHTKISADASKEKDAQLEAYGQLVGNLLHSNLISLSNETSGGGKSVEFTVSLRKPHIDFLKSHGISVKNNVIGTATAPTKKEAEHTAYINALNTLAKLGVTREWAEKTKHDKDFSDPQIVANLPAANRQLKRDGFKSMKFAISRKTTTYKGVVVQLVGVRSDGSSAVIESAYSAEGDFGQSTAKAQLVEKYANRR